MNLRDVRLWTTVVSVAGVLLLVAWDTKRTSPGPLAGAHAQLPELAAADGCNACHGGWFETMGGACLECHAPIEEQLAEGTGLHGAIADQVELAEGECALCHSEHRGAEFPLAGEASFGLAGFAAGADFDHAHVDFGLGGRHDDLTCAECHEHADTPLLAAGSRRFVGLVQECASCHEDPHDGRFARSCQSCHGQELAFAEVASFVHTDAFPLVGGHAVESCETCHEPQGPHAIEALAGFAQAPAPRDCAACHAATPHDEGFLREAAAMSNVASEASCALCHDAVHASFTGDPVTVPAELHAATGFALSAPHADLSCAQCHAPEGDFAARHPGRVHASCQSCHEDPHGGQFAGEALAGAVAEQGCLACHGEASFAPPAFDLETHASTAFPLEGTHRAVACSACHSAPSEGGPRAFSGTPSDCAACHGDPHAGLSSGTIAEESCDRCHGHGVFSEVRAGAFEHGLHAGFALEQAHAAAACESCHQPAGEAGVSGRTFGVAAATDCAGCHASVHDEFFAGEDCGSCHRSSHFADLDGDFAHGDWTGFALDGAHARASCESCHGVYPQPELAGRRLGRVAQMIEGPRERCETCHTGPHGGAFEGEGLPRTLEGRAGCARCHDTESFGGPQGGAAADFDHALWTGHALVGAHAAASCDACHGPVDAPEYGPARGARGFRRAAGRDCADCHADPHVGQFRGSGGAAPTDCARCHVEDGAFTDLDFDHRRDSRFALDESHVRLECAACHRPWPLPDGSEVVRYKPLGTQCVDCHDHGGGKNR